MPKKKAEAEGTVQESTEVETTEEVPVEIEKVRGQPYPVAGGLTRTDW